MGTRARGLGIGTVVPDTLRFALSRVRFELLRVLCIKAGVTRVTFPENKCFVSKIFDTLLDVFV